MAVAKKGFAVEFINRIRTMDSAELDALILREAGEELAQFFLTTARPSSRETRSAPSRTPRASC